MYLNVRALVFVEGLKAGPRRISFALRCAELVCVRACVRTSMRKRAVVLPSDIDFVVATSPTSSSSLFSADTMATLHYNPLFAGRRRRRECADAVATMCVCAMQQVTRGIFRKHRVRSRAVVGTSGGEGGGDDER